MSEIRICIDVPDLDRAVAFYTAALGLRQGRRNGAHWAEMLGARMSEISCHKAYSSVSSGHEK